MSLVENKIVSETNFNLTNKLGNLSMRYKCNTLEKTSPITSFFLYENYFEKKKFQAQTSLNKRLEEEFLIKQLLKDNFQLKRAQLNRVVKQASENNPIPIGPVCLLGSTNHFRKVNNFSVDDKKAYFAKRSALWAKTISRSIHRKDFFSKSVLIARSKCLVKARKKLRKNKSSLFTDTLLKAATKIGLFYLPHIKNRFSNKFNTRVKGLGLIKYLRLNKAKKQVMFRLKKRSRLKAIKKLTLKKLRSKKKLKWRRKSKKFQLLLRRRNNKRAKRLRLRKWRRFAPLGHYESNLKTFSFVHLGYSHGNSLAYKSFFPLQLGKFFNRLVY